jgi:hypothetical protein
MYDVYCFNLSYRKTNVQSLFRSALNLCSSCWSKSVICSKEFRPKILSGDNINAAAVVLHVAPETALVAAVHVAPDLAPAAVVLHVTPEIAPSAFNQLCNHPGTNKYTYSSFL